jgi:HAMP domain-containing protein
MRTLLLIVLFPVAACVLAAWFLIGAAIIHGKLAPHKDWVVEHKVKR